jgi:hypothetical protein
MAPFKTLEKQAVKVSPCYAVQTFLANRVLSSVSCVRRRLGPRQSSRGYKSSHAAFQSKRVAQQQAYGYEFTLRDYAAGFNGMH